MQELQGDTCVGSQGEGRPQDQGPCRKCHGHGRGPLGKEKQGSPLQDVLS